MLECCSTGHRNWYLLGIADFHTWDMAPMCIVCQEGKLYTSVPYPYLDTHTEGSLLRSYPASASISVTTGEQTLPHFCHDPFPPLLREVYTKLFLLRKVRQGQTVPAQYSSVQQ